MKTVVVDASLILRFLLEDNPGITKVVTVLLREAQDKKVSLISTPLLCLEIGNGLRFTLKEKELAEEVLAKFFQLPIAIIPLTVAQIQKSLTVSYRYKTTVYDASYHVAAIARRAVYLTADKDYYNRAKSLGHIRSVG